MLTVIDIECTYQGKFGSDDSDATPYNSLNKLVSVGYKTNTGESDYIVLHHKELSEKSTKEQFDKLQDVLNRSKCLIGHNLKFDMLWLLESGFTYEGRLYDTMIFEYVNARGLKTSLRLKDVLLRYKLQPKLDILETYCGEQGLNVDEVPLSELIKYGLNDVESTFDLYKEQVRLLKEDTIISSMIPAIKLMNDFLEVLIDVERQGIKIDLNALDKVEEEFRQRLNVLEVELKEIVQKVMGHTPINLNSGEQISWVLHSVKVKDKPKWREIFNLGSEERNGVFKKKYVKRYKILEFRQLLRENCETIKKTKAEQCPQCKGEGYIQLVKKDGTNRKNKNICPTCEKKGILYINTNEVAGFRIRPISSEYAADGGFSTSKESLDDLLATNLSSEARKFIELYKEYNAISSYLTSYVEGIRNNVRFNNILHTNFNQCVTATGRLSSSRPNLQNQPRENTFPIRKVFTSRFSGGKLLNADFKQLEFRVAAFLAACPQATKDILDNIDVHQQTADAITDHGEPTTRQDAKKSTFRPLYGGTSGSPAQLAYFEYFFDRYKGIFNWHNKLCEEAVSKKYIQSPSGRIYAFPGCTRKTNNSVTFATQIKNYEVQGFATGDILPVTMTLIYNEIKALRKTKGLKSVLCLTVHDSIVADCPEDEFEEVIEIFKQAFAKTIQALKERFNVDFNIPLDFDLDWGYNLLDKHKIKI